MLETTKANLEKNGFEVIIVEHGWQAFDLAKASLEAGMSVGLGGSTTVAQIGLLNYLETKPLGITLFNQYEKGISMEENTQRRRQGMLADLYITGCNAITQTGELVNADGAGNRVAAQIFGPKKLLLIVGINKLVPTLEAGFERIKTVAAEKGEAMIVVQPDFSCTIHPDLPLEELLVITAFLDLRRFDYYSHYELCRTAFHRGSSSYPFKTFKALLEKRSTRNSVG